MLFIIRNVKNINVLNHVLLKGGVVPISIETEGQGTVKIRVMRGEQYHKCYKVLKEYNYL